MLFFPDKATVAVRPFRESPTNLTDSSTKTDCFRHFTWVFSAFWITINDLSFAVFYAFVQLTILHLICESVEFPSVAWGDIHHIVTAVICNHGCRISPCDQIRTLLKYCAGQSIRGPINQDIVAAAANGEIRQGKKRGI